ncbi:MAG: short-chain dehydrogenase [Pseudomonadales bacterium]|nr:short-chain dehydrogenase [Pseudomonadales bacterium]
MTRTVLITGCSTGIGKNLAETLHGKGYKVIATARSEAKLASLGLVGIVTLPLDVTDNDSIAEAIQSIEQKGLSVDILINNAGYGAMGPLAEMPMDELEKQFATNVYGPVNMVRACLPMLRKSDQALIVNVGSVSGILVTPFSGAYCATKAALHALSDAFRMELAPFGIDVMTVMPGAIQSEFGNSAEASLARTLPEDSIYGWAKEGIEKRAQASQSNPTPTAEFVNKLVAQIEASNHKAEVAIGNGSTTFPLIARVIPTRLRDTLLKRTFGLNKKVSS